MGKYKVVWEVSKSTTVEAKNEAQAIEDVMNGNIISEDIKEDEITAQPEVFEVIS